MDLKQIIHAEFMGQRAVRAVRPFLESGADRAALAHVDHILAEVRHYAVIWDETRTLEDNGQLTADAAKERRQEAIIRLTTSVSPSRL